MKKKNSGNLELQGTSYVQTDENTVAEVNNGHHFHNNRPMRESALQQIDELNENVFEHRIAD